MNIRVDQLLHGYRRGHEQLAGSTRLAAKDAELVARLSDLSGTPTGSATFTPYLTAYPLPGNTHFAVAKTWSDVHASRAGCVLTHTLLVPMHSWRTINDPQGLAALHREPQGSDDTAWYLNPIEWNATERRTNKRFPPIPVEQTHQFVLLFFARGKRPVVWFDHPTAEHAAWRILCAVVASSPCAIFRLYALSSAPNAR
ncbi:MAG: hypothetical protein KatS3mg104_0774 [Phycisphaerae bacterium]|nr:MAG: hypothetical protein KatS3mg104_0774 [Phycisphaerae bacterium]